MSLGQVRELIFEQWRRAAEERRKAPPIDAPRKPRTPAQLAADKRSSERYTARLEAKRQYRRDAWERLRVLPPTPERLTP